MNYTYFSVKLLIWYNIIKRKLPWRKNKNPYFIWVSEIIMQQTRVSQGLNYYLRFIKQYPTVESLAKASEEDVLKLWQGLGYYSRARNMHFAAKTIVNELNGNFPSSFHDLMKLKGVGEYTAAAIASIAFDEKVPAIDGNVMRVISRIFGIEIPIDTRQGIKEIHKTASLLMPEKHPGDFNQAMMEFGALQCTPKKPECVSCIFSEICYATLHQKTGIIPMKQKKNKIRVRFFNYFYVENNGSTYIQQRHEKDIWENLYELPLIELHHETTLETLISSNEFTSIFGNNSIEIIHSTSIIKHQLSHQLIKARFIHILVENENFFIKGFKRIAKMNIFEFAVSRLIENFLKELGED